MRRRRSTWEIDPTASTSAAKGTPSSAEQESGEGNVIAHNGGGDPSGSGGIQVSGPAVTIRGNRIFDNRPLGIDLMNGYVGVTPNDPGDIDIFNEMTLQNFPIITSVVPATSTTHIEGSLSSMTEQTYDIDLYASPTCSRRPNDYLQGETYLESLQVTTDGFGTAPFAIDVPFVLAAGQLVTATATDQFGNTSEFSQRIVFSVDPPSGSAAGGTTATISGMSFAPGATVTVGVIPASNVVSVDAGTLTAMMPALSAGTLYGLTVSVPGGQTSTLPNGWLADFLDVPAANLFHDVCGAARRQRRRGGSRRRELRRRSVDAAPADGRVPAQGKARRLLHAAALHRGSSGTWPALRRLRTGSRHSRQKESPGAAATATTALKTPCGATRWQPSC